MRRRLLFGIIFASSLFVYIIVSTENVRQRIPFFDATAYGIRCYNEASTVEGIRSFVPESSMIFCVNVFLMSSYHPNKDQLTVILH